METRFRIIAVIGICGVAMLTLLISQYKNLNAQGDITNNFRERFTYQEPDRKRANREKQNTGKDGSARSKNLAAYQRKELKGDEDFYRVVVENNLFRPLGWQRPDRELQYTLMATLIESEGNKARAYMMDRRSNQFYYVGVGEKIGDAIVKDIESNQVTLNRAGDIMTIRAEANPFLSGAGGEDRGDRSLNRENRSNQNTENRDGKQRNLREIKNPFQDASPEERKRMRKQYRKTQGNQRQEQGEAKWEDNAKETDKEEAKDKEEVEDRGRMEGRDK